MAINPVQQNINTLNFKEQKKAIKTENNVKPLPPEGHLVHDTLLSIPKFWIQDIAYDLRAVKEGFQGKTNDHQQGRLNDVGLKVGGIGIAAYLASRTTDPKLRLMEYVGLGSFLAAMSLYPKIAINAPSRVVHGFDIGKEYIDDQGRKKSVFQDSNYIPFDMYKGEYPGEDLDIIGDRMGIPRDIKNRHDLIREQMRKIATQNNTLWMLTAGFATPVMAALMCVGLEKFLLTAMEKIRNASTNSKIAYILKASENMDELKPNYESNKVEDILKKYEGKELPKEEFDKVVSILSDKTDSKISDGIKEDLTKLLKSEPKFKTNAKEILNIIKKNIPIANREKLSRIFIVSPEEIETIINNISGGSKELTEEQIRALKSELKQLFASKPEANKPFYSIFGTNLTNKISESIKQKPVNTINSKQISQAVDFAKIIGDFKAKEKLADKYLSFKFEEAPETMLARSYAKFENTLFDVLDIRFKDMKKIKESPELAQRILDEKIKALASNDAKYQKAIKKLAAVMEEMDIKLNGSGENANNILNLIHATENIYNNTAKRLNGLSETAFTRTINQLIKEDVKGDLKHIISTREELIGLLDGTLAPDTSVKDWTLEYAVKNSKGVGSSKMDAISRVLDRYQGVRNSFNRILLTLDVYKREIPKGEYEQSVYNMGREFILKANSSQFNQKFKLDNNPELYRDIMLEIWGDNKLNTATEDSIKSAGGDRLLSRFREYIKRVKLVLGNNTIDFTKPHHLVNGEDVNAIYEQRALTRRSIFDLVAQDPVSMVKGGAARKYGSLDWLRKASVIGASVLGVAVIAQFLFGRIKNPQNIQKQVNDDENK